MEATFFNLRKHWIVAICATTMLVGAIVLHVRAASTSMLLEQIGVLILFIQFVWSGAYAIASLLSGKHSYFYQLLLFCIYCIAVLTTGIVLYLKNLS